MYPRAHEAWASYGGHGGHWRQGMDSRYRYNHACRLFDDLPDYSQPWLSHPWEKLVDEYSLSECPLEEYIKHLAMRYEGEVAIAWQRFDFHNGPLPRSAKLRHH